VYQGSNGGKLYIPLEESARILRDATPRLAKQVSSKYSNMSARKVQRDFSENHARKLSRDYIQNLGQAIGELIENEEERVSYTIPIKPSDIQCVSIGRDGTTMHIVEDGYRETMNGTISFYNGEGNRLHTIYLAQAPEYGKVNFSARFTKEIESVKFLLRNKQVTYVGLADGALDNWFYLDLHTDVSILDYWHVCEYLTKASEAASKSAYERKKWLEQARDDLLKREGGATYLLAQMKRFRRKHKLSKKAKESLERAITYFTNHHHQMDYPNYQNHNYPIGSGVTEAACKVIVKERCCQSGMKWRILGAQKTLTIRALYHTDGRWNQFWNYFDHHGFSEN